MSVPGSFVLLLSLLWAQDGPSGPSARPGNVSLIGARLSETTVQLGEVFQLTITAHVPPGHTVYFPDTLEIRNNVESAGRARATLRGIDADSMELVVVYPLRAFAIGSLTLPQADIFLQRAEDAEAGRGGAPVRIGRMEELSLAAPGSYTRRPIVPGSVEVEPVLPLARPEDGFQPRPPADVLGRDWGTPVYVLTGLGATVLTLALTLAGVWMLPKVRGRAPRAAAEPVPAGEPLTPQERALRELDAIRARGLHRAGRMDEFYSLATVVARRYVERLHPSLGPWLTDRELIERLTATNGASGVHAFRSVLRHSEVVRFGLHLPSPGEAEGDLDELRRWVAGYPAEGTAC
jgi:hypothetical protein